VERPLDKHAFLERIRAQKKYEAPLETGAYLGFFIPGDGLVLNRIQCDLNDGKPDLVACKVSKLFCD